MARTKGTKYIQTPEVLMELFAEYRVWVKKKPFKIKDWVGGMGKEVVREKERPLTLEGFENYCFDKGVIKNLGHYFSNLNNQYEDYLAICSHIRKIIREEQISGGMAGIYNPSITQRLNSLVEKTENKHEVNEIVIKREG
jgi:DNA-packaging protein gp3